MKALVLALLLAGCATTTPMVQIKTVYVPTPIRCTPNLGPEPTHPDTDAALNAAPDLVTWSKLLYEGHLIWQQRDREKSAALKECAG